MSVNIDGKNVKQVNPKDCVHYWVIDSPNGPQSQGTCKVCGIEKEFMNYLESSAWSSGDDKKKDDAKSKNNDKAKQPIKATKVTK
jgi:hypothetical protein